jgi:hypothetical protein
MKIIMIMIPLIVESKQIGLQFTPVAFVNEKIYR